MLASLAALVGCGSAGSATTPVGVASSRTSPATATSAPTAAPAPAPLPPLAVIQSASSLAAVNASGQVQWSLTQAEMDTLLSAAPHDTITARVAGPNVILSVVAAGATAQGRLVVLDGTGTSLGAGTFTPNHFADDVFGAPTGSEWAYSVDESPASADRHHGTIVVAGIGVAAHTVFSWVAPAGGYNELVAGWTDMGIVMERIGLGGCGLGFHPDTASFLVDPATGTLTDLFSGDHYADSRHGVKAAFAAQSSSAVVVNGTRFDEAGTVADGVYVSPDGSRVGVGRFSVVVCAGSPTLTVSTELIDVSSGAHSDVSGCEISGWFDTGHFVCSPLDSFSQTPTQRTEDLAGKAGANLGRGRYAGALQGD
jgi:hypothetical protein